MNGEIKIGIDPGVGGGIAWHITGCQPAAESMPDTPQELVNLLECIQKDGDVRVYLEEVGGYAGGPGNTGSSMFTFGRNFGQLLGVCAALGIPVELVKPQRWQKALGLGTSSGLSKSQWKNKLKVRATQLYPNVKVTLKVADALLIHHAAQKGLI
jgi:crossover junction endodeoxyribonuclease RuvC